MQCIRHTWSWHHLGSQQLLRWKNSAAVKSSGVFVVISRLNSRQNSDSSLQFQNWLLYTDWYDSLMELNVNYMQVKPLFWRSRHLLVLNNKKKKMKMLFILTFPQKIFPHREAKWLIVNHTDDCWIVCLPVGNISQLSSETQPKSLFKSCIPPPLVEASVYVPPTSPYLAPRQHKSGDFIHCTEKPDCCRDNNHRQTLKIY